MKKFDFKNVHLSHPQTKVLGPSASIKKMPTMPVQTTNDTITSTVSISNARLEEALLTYQWRSKTELPIVKVQDSQIISESKGRTQIAVSLEDFPLRLNELT